MAETFRSRIMEEADVRRALARIAHEIIERNGSATELTVLGVERRGAPLAERIADNIEQFSDIKVTRGTVDITFFRDDLENKPLPP
ncbi:MAG: bifunctional pyr operon transcriptional regulator/uracil phosphoribosyltransferase, partial [Clostridia bacterium]|nr:bifunctional pyr operon transcriptional regulator/uracil phosphoribosyltransferase [Clostridia bacterium]